ncbi:hypothetical protein DM02DRAFT_632209 [Periconia macrospinosa]|uniref:DUF8040 domain-containing protein n=1 Tax=Periconia macrospinosa TaxID=97972 RepID=A0A2V1DDM4_9PLEO|nr:hypothetical protein DM02DRAFT_632209 [Periconia macrospinosa]
MADGTTTRAAGVFEELTTWLRSNALVKDGRKTSVEEKLLTFLYICGHGVVLRLVVERCGRSISTISDGFHEVLDALTMAQEYLKKINKSARRRERRTSANKRKKREEEG